MSVQLEKNQILAISREGGLEPKKVLGQALQERYSPQEVVAGFQEIITDNLIKHGIDTESDEWSACPPYFYLFRVHFNSQTCLEGVDPLTLRILNQRIKRCHCLFEDPLVYPLHNYLDGRIDGLEEAKSLRNR